jgi:carboxyl-terminal processing protease
VILGTKSFGKGSVQTIIPLRGNDGAIRITTARYYTPNGRSIQDEGIQPDITVEPATIEPIVEAEPMLREADLKGALKNTGPDSAAGIPANATPTPSDQQPGGGAKVSVPDDGNPADATSSDIAAAAAKDYQLTRALDLLKGIALFGKAAAE